MDPGTTLGSVFAAFGLAGAAGAFVVWGRRRRA
ncbi:MAG: LPXTG cell wall anchor domain-containing protein [Thermoleophilaceae bacterium]|nr:LPXTG cell wall anchor domain-containing protein [Thermoleophilaceae bacterium]